ncbi:MAG: dihydroorotase [Propionibacteriaceae bacterium]|jgi:dihydroorotase|nr:dihydroorotase [Propionibacteriaceae bacterium]
MTELLLRGVRLADGSRRDLALRGELLVDPADLGPGHRSVAADGLIGLPGLVDLHTHLRQPGGEDAETVASGTKAAARGGYTACFAMANTDPVTDTAEAVDHLTELGRREGWAEVIPVGAITKGLAGHELAELGLMHRAGVSLFSDDGRCVQNAQVMRRALEYVSDFGGVLAQHSQDDDLAGPSACCHESAIGGKLGLPPWPAAAESVIVARDIELARLTGGRLHVCHVSSAESVELIRWAKARQLPVTAEVTPHHLLLDTAELEGYDTTYKVNPPLRTDEHVEALRQGLADGVIDAVATDHAPHTPEDKDHPFDVARPGMIGLEQALAVVIETMVLSGRLDWAGVVERMSSAPARIGQVADRQARPLEPGQPANLVLIDPTRRRVVDRAASSSQARNNPYHGRDLPDPVLATFWRGRATYGGDNL